MCGLLGAIGPNINPTIIRALALANRRRGRDSFGLFDSSGTIKEGSDPLDCLAKVKFIDFIERKHWFIAGHTRLATRGGISHQNSHPFRYGKYVGSHNGQVVAPNEYKVDSQYLIDRLNRCRGNYKKAFKGIQGYWVLTWYDGTHFYMQAHDNSVTLARVGDTWYYSSVKEHLVACIGKADEWRTLENGETIRFHSDGRLEELESFKSNAGRGGFRRASTSGYKVVQAQAQPQPQKPKAIGYHQSYQQQFERDFTLTMTEYLEADQWAMDQGYNGLYAYMRAEGIVDEMDAYEALEVATWDEHDQLVMDADFERVMDRDEIWE